MELLRVKIQPRISGDLGIDNGRLPGTERRAVQTSIDTSYISINGIDAKTGHNSELFRREWWDISRLDTSGYYVIQVTDNSIANTGWGFINVDDFRFLSRNPLSYNGEDSLRLHAITVKDFVDRTDQEVYVDYYTPLFGAADTHTHLMSHLSMGRKLMYGAPDIGSIVPRGTLYQTVDDPFGKDCNLEDLRASSVKEALGNCNAAHGGWGFDNTCGNYLRAMLINLAFDGEYIHRVPFESNMHGDHPHEGYPKFLHWPHYSSMSHQQMYVDWIKRAYEGGLRVLVTLAVNNELLGNMVSGDPPYDDKSTADLQLDEIKNFVERHNDFMELALTTSDMRRIIQSGKMAVIMGIEVDNLGSFNYPSNPANETTVRAEIGRLYDKGVRYIFPIHLTDNKFGGMAVYSVLFGFSNKFANTRPTAIGDSLPLGHMLHVETARDPLINYRLKLLSNDLPAGTTAGLTMVAKPILDFIGEMHFPPLIEFCFEAKVKCIPQFKIISSLLSEPGWDFYNAVPGGHANMQGLTSLGKFAVREMMKRGMIIDIDHMSEKSVSDAFDIAEPLHYPLISGHNGLREGYFKDPDHKVNENNRSRSQLTRLSNLGGVFGMGIGESNAHAFLQNCRKGLSMMGGKAVTMGSDINGFVTMPHPRAGSNVRYANDTHESTLSKYHFEEKEWDYNTEGVAHIGLYPDYFQDLKNLGMTKRERQVFFSAADYIINMWQQCERISSAVR
ncbi:MAG: membrane dipeptidase [Chitinophagaceae bacterium]